MSPCARTFELWRNLRLIGSSVGRQFGDDPLLVAIQTSRRLPRPVVATVARLLQLRTDRRPASSASLRVAYGEWLAGRSEQASLVLEAAHDRPRGPLGRRLLTELAIQLGQTHMVGADPLSQGGAVRARAAWQRGDVGLALAQASHDGRRIALRDRFASEAAVMTAGSLVTLASRPVRAPGPGPAAYHLLTNSLPHTQSGYSLRSHRVLTSQRDAGIRVAAATRLGYPITVGKLTAHHVEVIDGISYARPIPSRSAPTIAGRLRQQAELLAPRIEDFAPRVLHTTTPFTNAMVASALGHRLGLPWVYEVRGLLEETWVAGRPAGAEQEYAARSDRYRMLRAKEAEMARAADHVVTLSETLRDELVVRGVEASRISIVPNAVDPTFLGAVQTPPRARLALALPAAGFWVGTVSSLVDYEGLDTLIDAVAELRRRGVDARALLVGDGVARPALEERARRAGVAEHVCFVGRVPRDLAPAYHQALDVFVVPRRDVRVCRLVTPLKPIEAMACGRPVVASDLPALAELVSPQGTGLLVPPGNPVALADTLESLHDSPDLRSTFGEAGRRFAATRTWAKAGETYRLLYSQITEVARA